MNLNVVSLNQEPTAEEKRAQLGRILHSPVLQNSPMLQKLLEFVAASGMDGSAASVNEWVIATTVFGRSKEFDSATDTTVRTAVYRLRLKLRDYYSEYGKNDPVVIEIPKGHHLPIFTKRQCDLDGPGIVDPLTFDPPVEEPPRERKRPWLALMLSAGAVGALLSIAFYVRSSHAPAPPPSMAAQFWRAFAGNSRSVILAYSNAELLQTETRDLMRYDVGAVDDRGAVVDQALAARSVSNPEVLRGHNLFYEDGYTGTGEVQSVYALTRLLTKLGFDISVKRVRLLTPDDFKTHDVVLLGSPLENRALDDLHLNLGYSFELPLRSMWAGRIIDRKNPASTYTIERDPKTQALQSDYGVVSVLPGISPDRRIMILGGLTTSGTEGAAEFVTSDNHVSSLLHRLGTDANTSLSPFEAVIQVRVVRGLDPVELKCITARLSAR